MAQQAHLILNLGGPGLYIIQFPWEQAVCQWAGTHQAPASFPTTGAAPFFASPPQPQPTAFAPAFGAVPAAAAFPTTQPFFAFAPQPTARPTTPPVFASTPLPTAFAPAFAPSAAAFPSGPAVKAPSPSLFYASSAHTFPAEAPAVHAGPTLAPATPILAAPRPTHCLAAPAFLTASLPPNIPSIAPRDSPIMYAGGSPVVFATAAPSSPRRSPSHPTPDPAPTAPSSATVTADCSWDDEAPITPLAPPPAHARARTLARARCGSTSPPPAAWSPPGYILPPMSPFGGGYAAQHPEAAAL
ncbi:hypothetical protein FA95DRAFT_1611723 [Auriscalpium vulgare]|uniref:Uncharacterized protein n=1 Tax=Auriscalpium vulgare TaxID=40419 RepID=A0ACB8R9B9_9AGAM|nr:hypothetical protein FA95DRAFT_1611723 [Auriscalpium vulgare]